MIEREITVDAPELNWDDEKLYWKYGRGLREVMYGLPPDSTLYLNLEQCIFLDDLFALETVSLLQCFGGKGPVREKHLIVVDPQEEVFQAIFRACDSMSESFMCLKDGSLSIYGETFNPIMRRVMIAVLQSDEHGQKVSASDIHRSLGIGVQIASDTLKELHKNGFIRRFDDTGARGRAVLYSAFWPRNAKFLPEGAHGKLFWEITDPDNRKLLQFPHPRSIKQSLAS